MTRRILALIAAGLLSFGQAHAGSTFSSLPPAAQPLGSAAGVYVPTYVPMDQGTDCTATSPVACNTVQSDALRFAVPIQVSCALLLSPFQYQHCIDTSLNPPVEKEYIGSTWWPLLTLSPSSGPSLLLIASGVTSPFTVGGVSVTTTGTQLNYLNGATGITGTGLIVYNNGPTILTPAVTGGTYSGGTFTSPTINGAVMSAPSITNPVVTGGTYQNGTFTAPTINTPAVTGGTFNAPSITNPSIANPTITNPSITNPSITNPTVTGGTFASPAMTGTPTTPTATFGTSTSQVASTAFVQAAIAPPPGVSISGSPTIDATFCNKPIFAVGSAFYGITLPAPGTVPIGCPIDITNTDSRGKTITVPGMSNGGFGYAGCGIGNICPTQHVRYIGNSTSWIPQVLPGTWRPTGAVILYVSPSGTNTNDGLDLSAPLTYSFACTARAMIDTGASGSAGIIITIQKADGTYSAAPGATLCSITGNLGGGSPGLTLINGNNTTPTNVIDNVPASGTGLFTKDGGEVGVTNFLVQGNGASIGFFGAQFSILDINNGIFAGCMGANGNVFQFAQSASLNINSTVTLAGSPCTEGTLVYLLTTAMIGGTGRFTFPAGSWTFSGAVFFNQGGFWDFRSMLFTITGTVTGIRFANYNQTVAGTSMAGALFTGGAAPLSYFPGSIDQAFPLTFATDFSPKTPFAAVPPCPVPGGTFGLPYLIQDSTTNVWGAVISGGGANDVTAICSPFGGGSLTVTGK